METESNIWALSNEQLAEQCRAIAEGGAPSAGQELQAEAERLDASWCDALGSAGDDYDGRARKAAQQAALRKRTIEILVKLHRRR
jgi:hypothetical protein